MNVKDLYEELGGDYDDMFSRLNNEDLMTKIVKMFISDTSYSDLKKGLETSDAELAFRGAHTLKGVSLNLGFTNLSNLAVELTELLRPRDLNVDYKDLFNKITQEYNRTIEAIRKLD